nr:hypothetical protein [Baekduia sp.]
AIAANRRALLPLRPLAPELTRAVKNPWRTHGVDVDPRGVLASLPASEVRSVRIDPAVTLSIETDGVLGKPKLDGDTLRFTHSRKNTATVEGPYDRLVFLERTLPTDQRLMPDDLRSAVLPIDLDAFAEALAVRQDGIDELLAAGRAYVEAAERLVCALYGVSDALTERVIESAVARAGVIESADDS